MKRDDTQSKILDFSSAKPRLKGQRLKRLQDNSVLKGSGAAIAVMAEATETACIILKAHRQMNCDFDYQALLQLQIHLNLFAMSFSNQYEKFEQMMTDEERKQVEK